MREAIAVGETEEIAFEVACKELGVDVSKAKMEVINKAVKKTFGLFGGSPAKVRAYVMSPADVAADYLKVILEGMGLSDVTISKNETEEGAELTLSGDDIGFIIGHRGETLDSLQYLASLVANHQEEKYYRVTLDVGSFREKRKETLENLGRKMAIRAVKTGRNNSLEPMNPYERRIIHTAVQAVEGAKSWSEGEDLARHVVVGPVDGERVQRYNNRPRYNNNNNNNGRRNDRFQNNDRNQRNDRFQKNDGRRNTTQKPFAKISETAELPFSPAPLEDAAPAPKKIEDAPLYGRIELTK